MFADVEWEAVSEAIATRGWARIERGIDVEVGRAIEAAAPGPWQSLPDTEGGVHQAGSSCHSDIDGADRVVREFATWLHDGLDRGRPAAATPLPMFNHAEWCRAEAGRKFITPHRDPERAGGVIAILTTRGNAPFRVWPDEANASDEDLAEQWTTADGDIAVLRGHGWPYEFSRCPVHEAASPINGNRVTLTLRHNKGGYGADYFG